MANRIEKSGSRRRGASLAMAGVVASMLFGVSQGHADTTDQLLDQLKAKGILTKAEYQKLKARHESEVAARPAPGPGPGPAPNNGQYITKLDKGIGFRIPGNTIVSKENGVVTVGDVDVKISGDLIFFGAESFKSKVSGTAGFNPSGAPFGAVGGVLGGTANGSRVNNSNSIRSGLLPSAIVLSLATRQEGIDLSAVFGAYIGGNDVAPNVLNANGPGSPIGLGTSGIDLRQVYGTIGTPEIGTFKIGRDLGLFGGDAILNDFTLFGVGTPGGNAAPSNTALGRIGIGYVYPDWIPQITYTTPDFGGFTASVGIFTPISVFDATGFDIVSGLDTSGNMTAHDQPQIQGRIKYIGKFAPDVKLTAWADGLTQLQRAEVGDSVTINAAGFVNPGASVRSSAVDGGARLDWGPFSAVGYGYWGSALGTTGLFFDAVSPNGQARTSHGWYGEAEWTFFDRFTVGGSYGGSWLDANSFDFSQGYVPWLLKSNQSAIGFVRYKLTDWVALQAEFINSISRNQSGGAITTDAVVAGTTFFF
jgi:hypothetical protein